MGQYFKYLSLKIIWYSFIIPLNMLEQIKEKLGEIKKSSEISNQDFLQATALFRDDHCIMVAQSKSHFELLVEEQQKRNQVSIFINQEENIITALTNEKEPGWTVPALAALMQLEYEEQRFTLPDNMEGKKYTREGMKRRVLNEREQKAKYANYKIQLADNIYGEHQITNEKGVKYKVTLHDFEKETGYCNNMDWRTNKLGTTKHIIFLFKYFKEHSELFDRLSHEYPWVEIYLDPLQDYQISWHFPDELSEEIQSLLDQYFGKEKHIAEHKVADFLGFLQAAEEFEEILVRPEVNEKVEREYNRLAIAKLAATTPIDFSKIKAELFPYQQEGVTFATFKEGAIIADEMGLGKTIQAMADTVINFELPWNPAKKNQRIGRIDRIGQKSKQLTVIDLVTVNSIEMDIAAGLEVKQNLFEGVLDSHDSTNEVDLSKRGKEQFLEDIRNLLEQLEQPETEITEENEPEEEDLELEIVQHEASNEHPGQSDRQPAAETEEAVDEKENRSTTEQQHYEQVEKVMQDGMNFLSGMFKMSTGKEMGAENAKIEVNRQTGEVTMKFKMPGM